MAGLLEKITLKLDLQGFEQIQGLGRTFKKLETNAVLSQRQIKGLRTAILGVGKGASNTIGGLNAQVNALTRVREGARIGSRQFRLLTEEINRVNAAITKANASMNRSSFGRKDFMQGLGGIAGATAFGGPLPGATGLIGGGISKALGGSFLEGATGGIAAGFALKPVVEGIGSATTYAADIDKAKIALKAATKVQGDAAASAEAYRLAVAQADKAVRDFNVPQEVAIRGMTRLSAAVIGAGGNVHNAGLAFYNVLAAIKGTAGGSEDAKAAITALVQIYSKGKVSAEELSGQLGERFPAAVVEFQKANSDIYKSTADLQKALKDGTVGLAQLEKFLELLGGKYVEVAKEIGKSSQDAGARARVAFNDLRIAVGKTLQPVGAEIQEVGILLMQDLLPAAVNVAKAFLGLTKIVVPILKVIGERIVSITQLVGILTPVLGFMAFNAIASAAGFSTMGLAIGKATKAMGLFIKAQAKSLVLALTNPWILLATGIIAATILIKKFTGEYDEMVDSLKAGTASDELFEQAIRKRVKLEEKKLKLQERIRKIESGEVSSTPRGLKGLKDRLAETTEAWNELGAAMEAFVKGGSTSEIEAAMKKVFDSLQGAGGGSPLQKFADSLKDFKPAVEDAVVGAFQGLEDTIMDFVQTGKLAFADLARSIIADMARIAVRAAIVKPLMNFMFPGLFAAKGAAFAGNNIVPYRKGGVVSSPTMFKYGGSQLGVMGEAGPEAIMPLKRGKSGKLGVEMHGRGGGGVTNVNYTGPTLNFNGDEYVPKSAVGSIVNAAANKGANMGETATMRSLQNSRSARGRIGIR
jgi:tape measure domain-containing protein